MATWIAHLRLAENLLQMIDGLDPSQIAVGSVAPDCGIRDAKRDKFNPPAEVTHFLVSGDCARRIADLEFYRRYLTTLKHQNDDIMRFSFCLGYFFVGQ